MPIKLVAILQCSHCGKKQSTILEEFNQIRVWWVKHSGTIWLCEEHQAEYNKMMDELHRIEDEWLGVHHS